MITICFETVLPQSTTKRGSPNKQQQHQQHQQRNICQVSEECTVRDLFEQAAIVSVGGVAKNDVDKKTSSSSSSSSLIIESLKYGFPPKTLRLPVANDNNDDDDNKSNNPKIIDIGITNQEKIIIQLAVPVATTSTSKNTKRKVGKDNNNNNNNDTKITIDLSSTQPTSSLSLQEQQQEQSDQQQQQNHRPPRRKAAEIASESFTETIKLMTELERKEGTKNKNNKKTKVSDTNSMSKSTKEKLATARYFRNLEQQQLPLTTTTSAKNNAIPSPGGGGGSGGRRLYDGAVVVRSTATSRRNGTNNIQQPAGSTSGSTIEEALLNVTSSNTKIGRILRKGWKEAVNSVYEQNQAVARIAAIQANTVSYELFVSNNNTNTYTLSTGTPIQSLRVKYPKGIQGRNDSFYEDIIDELIDIPVLQSVIASIYNSTETKDPEALRPTNIALLSPRVLWCLMYHYTKRNDDNDNDNNSTNDKNDLVVMALRWIQPTLNWTYLRRRTTKLSEKAKENLRQQQEAEQRKQQMGTTNWDAAVSAIQSVEQAMENMYNNQDNNHNSNENSIGTESDLDNINWHLETPVEEDIDELKECIRAGNNEQDDDIKEDDINTLAELLLQKCHIHNWRELANAETEEIHTLLLCESSSSLVILKTLAQTVITVDRIETWIDYAQQQSVDEIMYEICDKNDNAIELLQHGVRSGTPKDLAFWLPIVSQLFDELQQYNNAFNLNDPNHQNNNIANNVVPSEDDLRTWCQRSKIALNQLEWLNWYTTPI